MKTRRRFRCGAGADITPLKEAVELAKFVPLPEITETYAGRWARTQGEIVDVMPGDKNTKLTLSDRDKRLTVLIWPDAWAGLPQADFQPGAKLTVRGEVNLFNGDLEIVTELPSDVEVLARAAPVTAQVKSIGAITPDDVKSLIVTQGAIETVKPFSLGTRYEFGDPSGSIILLVWNDAIDPQRQQELLAVGATLSVTGQIDEFNKQLEIVPRSADDIVVLAAPAAPTATPAPTTMTAPEATALPTVTAAPAATAAPTAAVEATAAAGPTAAPAANTPEPTESAGRVR